MTDLFLYPDDLFHGAAALPAHLAYKCQKVLLPQIFVFSRIYTRCSGRPCLSEVSAVSGDITPFLKAIVLQFMFSGGSGAVRVVV